MLDAYKKKNDELMVECSQVSMANDFNCLHKKYLYSFIQLREALVMQQASDEGVHKQNKGEEKENTDNCEGELYKAMSEKFSTMEEKMGRNE